MSWSLRGQLERDSTPLDTSQMTALKTRASNSQCCEIKRCDRYANCGPNVEPTNPGIFRIDVESAIEMNNAVQERLNKPIYLSA